MAHRVRILYRAGLIFLLAIILVGCDSSSPTPPAVVTPGVRPTFTPPPPLIVEYSWEIPAEISDQDVLVLSMTIINRGEQKINDLDLTIDTLFMENFIAGEGVPQPRVGQLPHYWNFLYGGLEPGETIQLTLNLHPGSSGDFTMLVRLLDLGRAGQPLVDTAGIEAGFEQRIVVSG